MPLPAGAVPPLPARSAGPPAFAPIPGVPLAVPAPPVAPSAADRSPPTPPAGSWKADPRAREDFSGAFGMRRDNPSAYQSVFLKGYRDRNPRDAQMDEEALRLLKKKFKANVEWELKGEEPLGDTHVQHL